MEKKEVINKLINIFEDNGIDVENQNIISEIDSLVYMTIIVEIEQIFNIDLPDTVLKENVFNDIDGFSNVIYQIVNGKWRKLQINKKGGIYV